MVITETFYYGLCVTFCQMNQKHGFCKDYDFKRILWQKFSPKCLIIQRDQPITLNVLLNKFKLFCGKQSHLLVLWNVCGYGSFSRRVQGTECKGINITEHTVLKLQVYKLLPEKSQSEDLSDLVWVELPVGPICFHNRWSPFIVEWTQCVILVYADSITRI